MDNRKIHNVEYTLSKLYLSLHATVLTRKKRRKKITAVKYVGSRVDRKEKKREKQNEEAVTIAMMTMHSRANKMHL